MKSFTTQQRIMVVQTYYEIGRSVKSTFRKLWNSVCQHSRPSVCDLPHFQLFREDCWCGIWAFDIIGPFFFENNREIVVTVNSENYR